MDDTQTSTTPTAKAKGMSLYDNQWQFLKRKARELTEKTGRPVSASKVNQMLIEEAMKKERGKK